MTKATATTTTAPSPADAPWTQHYSHRQVVGMLTRALDAATLRHEASTAATHTLGEAFLALRRYGVDFTELPGYRSDGCPEREGPYDLKATIGWTARISSEIKAAVHRRTLGAAMLVSTRVRPRKPAPMRPRHKPPVTLVASA